MCFRLWRRSPLSHLALSILSAERIFLTAWEGEALYTIARASIVRPDRSSGARYVGKGAVCRIREARHSAEEYERLKPNDGQPLDVWRIEVLVANYSGKTLA